MDVTNDVACKANDCDHNASLLDPDTIYLLIKTSNNLPPSPIVWRYTEFMVRSSNLHVFFSKSQFFNAARRLCMIVRTQNVGELVWKRMGRAVS